MPEGEASPSTTLDRADLEALRSARRQASQTNWAGLELKVRSSIDRIHHQLRVLAVQAVDHLGTEFEFGTTSGFAPGSGVRGYVPKDLWLTIFRKKDSAKNLFMPQIYLIVSERGLEFGFAAAIHPSDFSNSDLKAKLRGRVAAIFSALPEEGSDVIQRTNTRLQELPAYRFRMKARLDPGGTDYPDIIALWRFLKSAKGAEWGAGNICRYVKVDAVDNEVGFDMWPALQEALELFVPVLAQTDPPDVTRDDSRLVNEKSPEATAASPIGSAATISSLLGTLMDRYPEITSSTFGTSAELDAVFQGIQSSIEPVLRRLSYDKLFIDWSYGNGNWAAVPWVAIMDSRVTTSTQRGIYLVLLFRQDGSGAYLALEQGITDISTAQGYARGREELRFRSARYASLISSDLEVLGFQSDRTVELKSDLPRPRSYEQGAIVHKLYERQELPSDQEFEADLIALLRAYQKVLKFAESSPETTKPGGDRSKHVTQTWLIGLGQGGRLFEPFYRRNQIGIGWNKLGDLTNFSSQDDMAAALRKAYGGDTSRGNDAKTCYDFAHRMREGDRILVKSGVDAIIGAAVVTGEYVFEPGPFEYHNLRAVEWTHRGEWSVEGLPIKTLTEITKFPNLIDQIETLLDASSTTSSEPRVLEAQEELPAFSLDDAMRGLFIPRDKVERLLGVWRSKKNLILQGPPGVGKSFVARRLSYALMEKEDPSRVHTIQFHQSYAYEDFVQGYRPGGENFQLRNGPLVDFCDRAKADPSATYVFIIDEINRGNLSKIFGEALMLLEADKRSSDWAVSLAYSPPTAARFFIPPNVFVLGLMNTADRSLAVVDYALRRRFAFGNLEPEFTRPEFAKFLADAGVPQLVVSRLIDRISALNETIAADTVNLGAGFRVGHSFFCQPPADGQDGASWYKAIVETEILPLIEEYFFGLPDGPALVEDWRARLLADD